MRDERREPTDEPRAGEQLPAERQDAQDVAWCGMVWHDEPRTDEQLLAERQDAHELGGREGHVEEEADLRARQQVAQHLRQQQQVVVVHLDGAWFAWFGAVRFGPARFGSARVPVRFGLGRFQFGSIRFGSVTVTPACLLQRAPPRARIQCTSMVADLACGLGR